MRRRLAVALAALVSALALGSVIAAAGDLGVFDKPEPGVVTVPSKGPGQDYKSDPAPPEASHRHPLTLAQAVRAFNPTNDPNIRDCQREGDDAFVIEISDPVDRSKPTGSGIPHGKRC